MNWIFKILPGVGVDLPMALGIIHVYNHNIQRSFSLKQLGQSKSNFILEACV